MLGVAGLAGADAGGQGLAGQQQDDAVQGAGTQGRDGGRARGRRRLARVDDRVGGRQHVLAGDRIGAPEGDRHRGHAEAEVAAADAWRSGRWGNAPPGPSRVTSSRKFRTATPAASRAVMVTLMAWSTNLSPPGIAQVEMVHVVVAVDLHVGRGHRAVVGVDHAQAHGLAVGQEAHVVELELAAGQVAGAAGSTAATSGDMQLGVDEVGVHVGRAVGVDRAHVHAEVGLHGHRRPAGHHVGVDHGDLQVIEGQGVLAAPTVTRTIIARAKIAIRFDSTSSPATTSLEGFCHHSPAGSLQHAMRALPQNALLRAVSTA